MLKNLCQPLSVRNTFNINSSPWVDCNTWLLIPSLFILYSQNDDLSSNTLLSELNHNCFIWLLGPCRAQTWFLLQTCLSFPGTTPACFLPLSELPSVEPCMLCAPLWPGLYPLQSRLPPRLSQCVSGLISPPVGLSVGSRRGFLQPYLTKDTFMFSLILKTL